MPLEGPVSKREPKMPQRLAMGGVLATILLGLAARAYHNIMVDVTDLPNSAPAHSLSRQSPISGHLEPYGSQSLEASPPNNHNIQLPAACTSERPLRSCFFYEECVHAVHPCLHPEFDYALQFGAVYCNKFVKIMHQFSPYGQRWAESVRGCLQDELAARILSAVADGQPAFESCNHLEELAFGLHSHCYTMPGASICPSWSGLSLLDYVLIVRTIGG